MNTLVDVIVAVMSWLLGRNSGTLEPGISLLGPIDWTITEPCPPVSAFVSCPFFVADVGTGRCAYCDETRVAHSPRALAELA